MQKQTPTELHHRQQKLRSSPRLPVYLICENIRSLWNVGSIFRSADGAGIAKIYLTGYTGTPPRPEISKTALGAENSVPWEAMRDPAKAVTILHKEGVPVYTLEQTRKSVLIWEQPLPVPLGLVIGNEVDGISPAVMSLADGAIELPMYGIKESLNVAVACGIALYEITRQNQTFYGKHGL